MRQCLTPRDSSSSRFDSATLPNLYFFYAQIYKNNMHQPQHIISYIHLGIRPLLTAVVCYLNRAKSYAILNNFFTSIFNRATNDFFVYFPAGIFLNASSHTGHTILPSGIDSLQKRHVLSLLILLLLSVEIFTSCHDNKIFFSHMLYISPFFV